MQRMNGVGHTVFLHRTAEQIARRLSPYGRRKRPRLRGLDDAGLVAFMERDMAVREPFYAQAHLVVDCDAMSGRPGRGAYPEATRPEIEKTLRLRPREYPGRGNRSERYDAAVPRTMICCNS